MPAAITEAPAGGSSGLAYAPSFGLQGKVVSRFPVRLQTKRPLTPLY